MWLYCKKINWNGPWVEMENVIDDYKSRRFVVSRPHCGFELGDTTLQGLFCGVCKVYSTMMFLKNRFGVYHIIYGSPLSSWATSQLLNNFRNGITIFMKTIDLNP